MIGTAFISLGDDTCYTTSSKPRSVCSGLTFEISGSDGVTFQTLTAQSIVVDFGFAMQTLKTLDCLVSFVSNQSRASETLHSKVRLQVEIQT